MSAPIFLFLLDASDLNPIPPPGEKFMVTESGKQMITESGNPMITEST